VRPSGRQLVRGPLGLAQERVSLTPALTWLYRSRADMGLARLHHAGVLLVASLLLVLTAATGVHGACNGICKRDVARCVATQCFRPGPGRSSVHPTRCRSATSASTRTRRAYGRSIHSRFSSRVTVSRSTPGD